MAGIISRPVPFAASSEGPMPPVQSWSVMAIAANPILSAYLTTSSGENVPSEKEVWTCRSAFLSVICFALFKNSIQNAVYEFSGFGVAEFLCQVNGFVYGKKS